MKGLLEMGRKISNCIGVILRGRYISRWLGAATIAFLILLFHSSLAEGRLGVTVES